MFERKSFSENLFGETQFINLKIFQTIQKVRTKRRKRKS